VVTISNFHLHSRLTLLFLLLAIVSAVIYLTIVLIFIDKFEETMMATLVGHEIDELVTELAINPDVTMPLTATIKTFLRSREQLSPIPDFLTELDPNVYQQVKVGDRTYHVTIFDLQEDRFYLAFDTTDIDKNRFLLIYLLVGGGFIATLVLLVSGFWLSRKFLFPISKLAREVSTMDVSDHGARLEGKYQKYEVGVIARSIDQFLDRMDDFIEREQSFTAATSHELRTPVAVVMSATELLELKGLSSQQQKVVDRIKEASVYMANVIDALLFLARNTFDKVEKTVPGIKLHAAALVITKKYVALAAGNNLELAFKFKNRLKVRLSESHLEIILGNLIRNAINNTDKGRIDVTVFENCLSIKDTGRGIAAEEASLILKQNYRSADSEGYGLGLFLVSQICNIYAIKLDIKSSIGEGAEFLLTFPEDMCSWDPKDDSDS
jgi:signal transduction histidine kinase